MNSSMSMPSLVAQCWEEFSATSFKNPLAKPYMHSKSSFVLAFSPAVALFVALNSAYVSNQRIINSVS